MVRRMVLSTALVLALLGDFRGAAAQSCAVQAPRYNLSADTVDWSMKIASGRSCVRGLRFRGFDIESVKLVARPQFGQVTVQGPGFRYTSKPNYNGPDSFSLAVLGRSNKQRGSSTIRIKVAVGESIATKDVTSPSVAFIMPSNGSTVSGSVTLTATASDDVAVANVQFFVDGVAIGSPVTASPYTTTWDCTGMADGPHVLDAIAQDTSGNHATSSINVMVENIGP
jgi:Bacterial Ig domain